MPRMFRCVMDSRRMSGYYAAILIRKKQHFQWSLRITVEFGSLIRPDLLLCSSHFLICVWVGCPYLVLANSICSQQI